VIPRRRRAIVSIMCRKARTGLCPVLFFALASACIARSASAQFVVRSWLSWRTAETEHFAFHYPTELETWTRAVASHIEAIDTAVSRIVGYTPGKKTQIVVDDPYEEPNGSAWPYLDGPLIVLWAAAPTPRDDIGEFRTWGNMLVSHEFAHIAHLTRPSRNSAVRHLWEALAVNLGPIALRAPRWAIEGYATYVEGRVSGSGRPFGMWRAAFLRQWGIEGQLPRYDQLNEWGAYEGGEFAYLAGSAFLEWLVERRGDSSLVDVWRRLSAKQNRSFDEAFAGVFGESPAALYGRFSADVTSKAAEAARDIRAVGADTGSIEQRLTRSTGDPAISADGQRIAVVVRSATLPSRVVIWGTAAEPDTGRARRDSLLRARDPEDVPARPIFPPAKRPLATLRSSGASYESPRFLRDGRVLLWKSTPRGNGSLSNDLFIWDSQRHHVTRVTHDASLTDADPMSDGTSAYATRCRHGWCDLASVDLRSGDVTLVADGSPTRSFYRPRVRPGSADAIVSVHDGSRWRLAVFEAAAKSIHVLDIADSANRYDAAWISPTQVVAVTERGGVANLETFDIAELKPTQITSVTGAAVAPEPQPRTSSVWFLSLYSRGYDLRRVNTATSRARSSLALAPSLAPVAPPMPNSPPPFGMNRVSESGPFGLTPRFFRWIPQPAVDADALSGGLTLSTRDLIGRSELTATGAYGQAASWRGGNVSGIWRGFLPAIRVQAFAAEQRLSESHSPITGSLSSSDSAIRRLDTRLAGGIAYLDGAHAFESWSARYRIGGSASQLRDEPPNTRTKTGSRMLGFVDAGVSFVQRGDGVSISESLASNVTTASTFDVAWTRGSVSAGFALGGAHVLLPFSATGTYGRMTRDAPLFEQLALGGGPSLVLDRLLLTQRWSMPALPAEIAVGSSAVTYRVNLPAPPFVWYWWGGATSPEGDTFHDWHNVVGVEWSQSVLAIAPAGTPAARAQIGVGESLDQPFRRKVRAYASLVINP
jgi:hypothetical protein